MMWLFILKDEKNKIPNVSFSEMAYFIYMLFYHEEVKFLRLYCIELTEELIYTASTFNIIFKN